VKGEPVTVFVGRKDGKVVSFAYETTADGFGGELGVMVGYDVAKDELTGIGITSQKETPGVGARVTQEEFTSRFAGKAIDTRFRVAQDGGDIDALTGATISSRAVCAAVAESAEESAEIKAQVVDRQ
jgi:electron transport complex protein RnfG